MKKTREEYWVYMAEKRMANKNKAEKLFSEFCTIANIEPEVLSGGSRKGWIVKRRHIFHYFAHRCMNLGSAQVASLTGVTHASVLHSCNIVCTQMPYFYDLIVDTEIILKKM
jgi:chromosomal replication initiation ATPase DnaA